MNRRTVDHTDTDSAIRVRSSRGLHRFACVMVVLTVGLVAAGAMVTSTGSGLSVPDWPTTYGENMFTFPFSKWVGGIFYEHGHRLFAATVGFLTIVLAVYAQLRARRRAVRILGWTALVAVIAQGILGGMTVRFLLPAWISVFHACLAQTFLCILMTMAVLTHRRWDQRADIADFSDSFGRRRRASVAPVALVAVIFAQLIAGAVMRHTESGLAVPDFPLAYGHVLPSLSDEAMLRYNDQRAFDHELSSVTRGQVVAHLTHRAGAIVVCVALVVAGISAWRRRDDSPESRRAILFVAGLVVLQVALGAYSVWSRRLPVVATAHVAVGAATLAAAWRAMLLARRNAAIGVVSDLSASVPGGALAGAIA